MSFGRESLSISSVVEKELLKSYHTGLRLLMNLHLNSIKRSLINRYKMSCRGKILKELEEKNLHPERQLLLLNQGMLSLKRLGELLAMVFKNLLKIKIMTPSMKTLQ